MNRAVQFSERQIEEMAKFLYHLTVLGAGYKVDTLCGGWTVEVTGF